MRTFLFYILLLVSISVFSQDTIVVMHYNLLKYAVNEGSCNSTTNNVDTKDVNIKKITKYVMPDILTVNEMSKYATNQQRILDNVLNTDGVTKYKRITTTNYANSSIVNQLYYNSEKIVVASTDVIITSLRDVNVINMYYKSPDVVNNHDTAWIRCIVAHLKAGSYDSDAAERADMTNKIMAYLNNINKAENYLMMGDFNVYDSDEVAFQDLINYSNVTVRFYDPINKIGSWNNNSSFAAFHTQSTHSDDNGCASSGGMDDRFDFILASNNVINGLAKVTYVPGSYKAVGQDGYHFNNSINYGTNNAVSAEIADALYGNSDHLPVTLKLKIGQTPASVSDQTINKFNISINNPVNENLMVSVSGYINAGKLNCEIYDMVGHKVMSKQFSTDNDISLNTSSLTNSMYLLKITDNKGYSVTKKFIKN